MMTFRRGSGIPVFLAVLLAMPPLAIAQDSPGQATSTLSGRILAADDTPVIGAKVLAYHLSSERVFTSELTSSRGEYSIEGLPYGYFDIAVETADGLFVANQVVNVAPSSQSVLTLSLHSFAAGAAGADEGRAFPGTDQEPVGVARVTEKLSRKDFWRSPKGVGILAGGGGALLLLLAGGGSSSSASPSTP